MPADVIRINRPGGQNKSRSRQKIVYEAQPRQQAFITCPADQILYGGARGGGKGFGIIGHWLAHMLTYGEHAFGLFIRKTYRELQQFERDTRRIFPYFGGEYSKTDKAWTFDNGAVLMLAYLRRDADAESYMGQSYTVIYVDEAGNFINPDPLDRLAGSLRSAQGVPCSMRLTANPGGPGHKWLKDRFVIPGGKLGMRIIKDRASKQSRVYIPSRLVDNPALLKSDPHYLRRLYASGPKWLIQAWLKGDWDASADGGVIKPHWFRYFDDVPFPIRTIISMDTANKQKDSSAFTAAGVWQETISGMYLVDLYHEKVEYPQLRRDTISLCEKWKPNVLLIEDKASGIQLIQDLQESTKLPVEPIEPKGTKYERIEAESKMFENGKVHFKHGAFWAPDVENELTLYPLGASDIVDMTSQVLKWVRENGLGHLVASSGIQRTSNTDAVHETSPSKGWGTVTADSPY